MTYQWKYGHFTICYIHSREVSYPNHNCRRHLQGHCYSDTSSCPENGKSEGEGVSFLTLSMWDYGIGVLVQK